MMVWGVLNVTDERVDVACRLFTHQFVCVQYAKNLTVLREPIPRSSGITIVYSSKKWEVELMCLEIRD
jgi:hypothetical protein